MQQSNSELTKKFVPKFKPSLHNKTPMFETKKKKVIRRGTVSFLTQSFLTKISRASPDRKGSSFRLLPKENLSKLGASKDNVSGMRKTEASSKNNTVEKQAGGKKVTREFRASNLFQSESTYRPHSLPGSFASTIKPRG
jgi:hypothetical protein